jgi:hypothetical protein
MFNHRLEFRTGAGHAECMKLIDKPTLAVRNMVLFNQKNQNSAVPLLLENAQTAQKLTRIH